MNQSFPVICLGFFRVIISWSYTSSQCQSRLTKQNKCLWHPLENYSHKFRTKQTLKHIDKLQPNKFTLMSRYTYIFTYSFKLIYIYKFVLLDSEKYQQVQKLQLLIQQSFLAVLLWLKSRQVNPMSCRSEERNSGKGGSSQSLMNHFWLILNIQSAGFGNSEGLLLAPWSVSLSGAEYAVGLWPFVIIVTIVILTQKLNGRTEQSLQLWYTAHQVYCIFSFLFIVVVVVGSQFLWRFVSLADAHLAPELGLIDAHHLKLRVPCSEDPGRDL